MYTKLGLQVYTVRDYIKDEQSMEDTFKRLAEMGYSELHTAGYESETFARLADKYGLSVVGTHYSLDKIVNNVEETVALHKTLGTTNIGVGGCSARSYDEIMAFIEKYNKSAAEYAKYGFKLTYHNHSFEFVEVKDGKSMMDLLVENLDKDNISFVLDTCWVANAGCDVCAWIEKLQGRIDILHLKDLKVLFADEGRWAVRQQLCEIGNGNLDWGKILATAEATGIKHVVVEQDNTWIDGDPFKSLEASRKYLYQFIK
ncbi:MAG: sugar phosphate isomerase/epimerase [Clostridia bacterium]|nr:sugar phosphate isomerase/epimerase [Clostridia bacterium]